MSAAGTVVIERVLNVIKRGGRIPQLPLMSLCDLGLSDDGIAVTVRPESEGRAPKWLKGLSIAYGEVQKVSVEKHDHPIPVKEGDPLVYGLDLQYSKGSHFWDKNVLHFAFTTVQYGTFREFILNRLTLSGRAFLPQD